MIRSGRLRASRSRRTSRRSRRPRSSPPNSSPPCGCGSVATRCPTRSTAAAATEAGCARAPGAAPLPLDALRPAEGLHPVDGAGVEMQGLGAAADLERNLALWPVVSPQCLVEGSEVADRDAVDGEDEVARLQAGFFGRAFRRQ